MHQTSSPKLMTVDECKVWWEDKVSHGYFEGYPMAFEQPQLISQFKLDKNSFVLEIGAGTGRETSQFCKLSDHVYAVDISRTAVELIRKHAPTAIVREFDGNHLDFQENMFDLIYNCFVIQHMAKIKAVSLTYEAFRLLKPGGSLLFEFLDCVPFNAGKGKDAYSIESATSKMFNNGFTQPEILDFFESIGIKVAWMYGVNHGPPEGVAHDAWNHFVCAKKI